jgi:polyhydroxyalkanoate synthase subunit PhaC
MGDRRSSTTAEQAQFAATIVTSAAAPTNFLMSNPAALKRAFETGGMSLARGARNFVHDVRHNGGMPSMTEPGAFEVGRDLAVTPGAVVARDDVAEVLQYTPTTDEVYGRPVLVIPPPIGRFYFLDLRPGRSFVEYATSRGLQTFMLSWRNPIAEQGHWNLDTYAAAVSSAIVGEQLPDGRQAAGLRHPGLERGRHQPSRRAARPVPGHLPGQPAHPARAA